MLRDRFLQDQLSKGLGGGGKEGEGEGWIDLNVIASFPRMRALTPTLLHSNSAPAVTFTAGMPPSFSSSPSSNATAITVLASSHSDQQPQQPEPIGEEVLEAIVKALVPSRSVEARQVYVGGEGARFGGGAVSEQKRNGPEGTPAHQGARRPEIN